MCTNVSRKQPTHKRLSKTDIRVSCTVGFPIALLVINTGAEELLSKFA